MSYTLNQAPDVMNIAECQYGVSEVIQFTKFTSCIGVFAKVKNETKVIGIHLVMVNDASDEFTEKSVKEVVRVLNEQDYDAAKVIIIGRIDYWKTSVEVAYSALVKEIKPTKEFSFGDGVYGATVDSNEDIEIRY
jgi:hypothetical protein